MIQHLAFSPSTPEWLNAKVLNAERSPTNSQSTRP
jgi:hypothetical protein